MDSGKKTSFIEAFYDEYIKNYPSYGGKKEASMPAKIAKCIFDIKYREEAISNLTKVFE